MQMRKPHFSMLEKELRTSAARPVAAISILFVIYPISTFTSLIRTHWAITYGKISAVSSQQLTIQKAAKVALRGCRIPILRR
jgi:hypothetical protein